MPVSSKLLERAIKLIQAGNPHDARNLLVAVLRADPANPQARAWYVAACETDDERIWALEQFLQVSPGHAGAQKQLLELLRAKNVRTPSASKQEKKPVTSQKRSPILWLGLLCLLLVVFLVINVGKVSALKSTNKHLEIERSSLVDANSRLTANLSDLNSEYEFLNTNYTALQTDYNNLQTSYADLSYQYNTLSGEYSTLSSTAIRPPYIYIYNRDVRLAFVKLDGTLLYWTVPFQSLEADLNRGNLMRNWLAANPDERLIVDNRFVNERYSVIDERPFVDPDLFANVVPQLYYQAGDDYTFIREMWNIVAQLTAYSSEITDTPRYPLETLLAGGGDCEDHAILFASLILAAPVDWDVEMVYLDAYHPTAPETLNHVIVYIDTGNRQYWIEATGKYVMEPYGQAVEGWYFPIETSGY